MKGTVLWPHPPSGGSLPPGREPGDAAAVVTPTNLAVPSLLHAAATGDVARVASLLHRYPGIASAAGVLPGANQRGGWRTALHHAVDGGHETVVALLLAHGADANAHDHGGAATDDAPPPLHLAAERGQLGVVRLLVSRGAEIASGETYRGLDVLGWATCVGGGRRDVVNYLVAHGARWTIWSAVAKGENELVRALVARDRMTPAWRMDRAHRRRTPLHLAVEQGQAATAATLLDLGAPMEARDADGLTPLDRAALGGRSEMCELLLACGAVVGLPAAVGLDQLDHVERLLAAQRGCLGPGGRWETLIVRAAERGSGAMLELLLRHGASANAREMPEGASEGTVGFSALHAAASHGNLAAAGVLLRAGADVTARESRSCLTPAGWARRGGHVAVQELILAGPIDLIEAVEFGLVERIPEIVRRDPGGVERRFGEVAGCAGEGEGWMTPLEMAMGLGREEVVRVLRLYGAEEEGRDPEDHSPQ